MKALWSRCEADPLGPAPRWCPDTPFGTTGQEQKAETTPSIATLSTALQPRDYPPVRPRASSLVLLSPCGTEERDQRRIDLSCLPTTYRDEPTRRPSNSTPSREHSGVAAP
jgi:hypothetical protein